MEQGKMRMGIESERSKEASPKAPIRTAAMTAAQNGEYGVLKECLDAGADTEAFDKEGWTALMYAAANNEASCAWLLIQRGARLDAKCISHGWTAAMMAAKWGSLDALVLLAKSGADLNVEGVGGESAVFLAMERRQYGAIELLGKWGANMEYARVLKRNGNAASFARYAIVRDDAPALKALLAAGARVEAEAGRKNEARLSLAEYAVEKEKPKCLAEILVGGTRPEKAIARALALANKKVKDGFASPETLHCISLIEERELARLLGGGGGPRGKSENESVEEARVRNKSLRI